ncbi:kinase-like domain-containing protein [Daldinia caldariorum]|uniref:kinase-like domain-containing protein n=1 Tax=Daldinia caldariorum TaxID=326644 RepID=UPI0020080225|nr:kinase-like domain-containing protein [Daldinia caldariorum]KAI1467941.1 kinase-like domain-containing protein [Daldinia caldariorum]
MSSDTQQTPSGVQRALESSDPLPVKPEEITAEWCSKVLGHAVKSVSIVKQIHSTSSKILIDLTYEDDGNAANVPTQLCVKGGFNTEMIALYPSLSWTYRREALFYHSLAPIVKMELPKAWYCGTYKASGQGLVVMSNLEAEGCEFGEPLKPWSVDRVRAGVEQLAALHAGTWGASEERFPWLSEDKLLGGNPLKGMITSLISPKAWEVRFKDSAPPPLPKAALDRERLERAFQTMWATENPKLKCIIHGDPHIGNTFIRPDGKPGFLDWQAPISSVNFHDVAYFITGSLTIEERRKHDTDIVKHYLKALYEGGGPKLELEEIWDDYRKHALHGLAWALTAPGMQPDENVFAMTERHGAAVEDYKTLELLESLPEYTKV